MLAWPASSIPPSPLRILVCLLLTILNVVTSAATYTLSELLAQQGSSVVGCLTLPLVDPSLFASSAFTSIDLRLLLATPLTLQATLCMPLTTSQASFFSSNSNVTVNSLGVTVYALPATFSPAWQSYVAGNPLTSVSLPLVLLPSNTADEWTLLSQSLASNGYMTLALPLSSTCPLLTIETSGLPNSLLSAEMACVAAVQRLLVFGMDSVQAEMQTSTSPLYTTSSLTAVWRVVYVAAGGLCTLLLSVVQQLAVTNDLSTRVGVTHAGVYCVEPNSVPLSVGYPAFFSPPASFTPAVVLLSSTSFVSLSSASSCLSPPAQFASPIYSLLLTQPSPPTCLTSVQSSAAATHPCLYTEAALRVELLTGSVSSVDQCMREDQCRRAMSLRAGTSDWVGASSDGVMSAVGHRVLLWQLLAGWLSWIASGAAAGSEWTGWRQVLQDGTASGVLDSFTQNCIVDGTRYNQ